MEKFIKDYGILIIVGVAVYWFFIRKKEEEVVVVDEDSSTYTKGSGKCYCADGNSCTCGHTCISDGSICAAGGLSTKSNGRKKLRRIRIRNPWK